MDKSKLAVIKVGGDVLLDSDELMGLVKNIHSLIEQQWQVVVVHGGGPQTNRLQQKHGLVPNKVAGRRVTGEQDLLVVAQAIAGEVNVALTSALQQLSINAFGFHGASGQTVQATKRPPRVMAGAGSTPIDYGEVGDITGINSELLLGLLDLQVVPVIATLGVGDKGRIFNINADTTVAEIAKCLQADLLLLTTQIGGIFQDLDRPDSRLLEVTPATAKSLIEDGVIQGGMIPKVEEAVSLLTQGVNSIAIVSGRELGAFLSVANNEGRFGTVIHL